MSDGASLANVETKVYSRRPYLTCDKAPQPNEKFAVDVVDTNVPTRVGADPSFLTNTSLAHNIKKLDLISNRTVFITVYK